MNLILIGLVDELQVTAVLRWCGFVYFKIIIKSENYIIEISTKII